MKVDTKFEIINFLIRNHEHTTLLFLAVQSSSRSLVVCLSVGWSYYLCPTLRSWLHETSALIMALSPDWRTTTHRSGVPTVFQEHQVCQGFWKTVRNQFQSPGVLQSGGQYPISC